MKKMESSTAYCEIESTCARSSSEAVGWVFERDERAFLGLEVALGRGAESGFARERRFPAGMVSVGEVRGQGGKAALVVKETALYTVPVPDQSDEPIHTRTVKEHCQRRM